MGYMFQNRIMHSYSAVKQMIYLPFDITSYAKLLILLDLSKLQKKVQRATSFKPVESHSSRLYNQRTIAIF